MTIGFSSAVCPGLDLTALIDQAQALGFKALELRGLTGHTHLPACPALKEPATVTAAFRAAGVDLVSLGSDCQVGHSDRRTCKQNETRLRETLDLAGQLACPFVTVKTALVPAFHDRDHTLGHIVDALRGLAPYAAEQQVSILVENCGSFVASRDLWYILDAVGHAAVRCCWNPCDAIAAGDSHSLAVPRIGRSTAITHLVDATLTPSRRVEQIVPIGHGQTELGHYLLLMHGIGAQTHLIVDSHAGSDNPSPREFLAAAKAWLDAELKRIEQTPELSAYKGDKNAPRYTAPTMRAHANG